MKSIYLLNYFIDNSIKRGKISIIIPNIVWNIYFEFFYYVVHHLCDYPLACVIITGTRRFGNCPFTFIDKLISF